MTVTTPSRRPSARVLTLTLAAAGTLGAVPGLALAAPATAAPAPTTARLTANHRTVTAGDKVTLTATLSVARAKVTFYRTVSGSSAQALATSTTDAHGHATVSGPTAYSGVYTVRYAGDSAHAAASAKVSVAARVRAVLRLGKYFKTSGRYRLFHASKKGVVAVALAPSKAGRKVTFRMQVLRNKHWRTIDAAATKLDRDSITGRYFRGSAGHKYRLRAEYAGDARNAGVTTRWAYARFVR